MNKDYCKCENVEVGTYANQINIIPPEWSSREFISIDRCLKEEIEYLWDEGIITHGCCCGHKEVLPFINVEEEQYERMIELGYTLLTNPHITNGKQRKDTWYPKSIRIEPQMIENHINHYYECGLLKKK